MLNKPYLKKNVSWSCGHVSTGSGKSQRVGLIWTLTFS